MRLKRFVLIALSFGLLIPVARAQSNEMGVVLRPLLSEKLEMGVWYKYPLNYSSSLRATVFMDFGIDREVRADSLSLNEGRVAYLIAVGWQKSTILDKEKRWSAYAGFDAYWDSEFIKPATQDYYGYFYSLGIQPLAAMSYIAFKKMRFSLEVRSDLNFNFQSYSADGDNYDRRFRLTPFDQFALGVGYLF